MTHGLAVATLYLAWFLGPADLTQAELWQRADAAKTADEVAALEPALAKLPQEWRAFRTIDVSTAWLRLKRPDDALRVLDEHRQEVREEEQVVLDEARVRTLRVAGREDEAIAASRKILASIDEAPKSSSWNDRVANGLHRELAGIYQRLSRFREALAEHALWHPDTHCGTCNEGEATERSLDIARCRFGLGEVDAALDGFFAVAADTSGRRSDGPALFVEHAARTGRLEAAKNRIAGLGAEARAQFELPLVITGAWIARDAKALVAATAVAFDAKAMQARRWDALRLAARFLADLGEAGTSVLVARIEAGDAASAFLAGIGPFAAARGAVAARRKASTDENEQRILDWVLASIDAAAARR